MITIDKGFINYKNYRIPVFEILDFIENNDEFLLNTPIKDLMEIFVFGIPDNFKQLLIKKVRLYDASSYINSFIYNNKEYWLDKNLRASLNILINTIQSSANPEESLEIILGEDIYTFNLTDFKNLLNLLENYAYKCKIVTLKHINVIALIQGPSNIEEEEDFINFITNYDITSGYPEKIKL